MSENMIENREQGITKLEDKLYLLKKGESYYIPSDQWRSLLYNSWSNKSGYSYYEMPYHWLRENGDLIFKLGCGTQKKRVYCLCEYDTELLKNKTALLFTSLRDKDGKIIFLNLRELNY